MNIQHSIQSSPDDKHPDYDHLWKDVITELFEEFLLFFAPDLFEQVDFQVPPEFLEQELQTIIPESDSNKRIADKLVKLQLKSGKEQWVYVHIEVQGGNKKVFPERMFQSFYRIYDLFHQKIYALALFTDEDSKYNLDQYHYDFFGTTLNYRYNSYRIATQTESELLQSTNPFALAILAGLYVLKSKKNTDLKIQYKRKLMRLLLEGKIVNKESKREYIKKLFIFMDYIMRLPVENELALIRELKPLLGKEEDIMGLSFEGTSLAKYLKYEARAEGKAEGIAEGKKEKAVEIATKLLQKGFSVEDVSENTGLTLFEVRSLQEKLSSED